MIARMQVEFVVCRMLLSHPLKAESKVDLSIGSLNIRSRA
jgi:hypothetical protein